MKVVSQNKKAFHDYFILDTYEAGIELKGTEIKSVRKGSVNLKDSFIRIKDNEAFIENMHIAPYVQEKRFAKASLPIMDGEGFEPSKALPTDLQSAPFGHSGIHP